VSIIILFGLAVQAMLMSSGIRQGCLASGNLFVLVLSPWLVYMSTQGPLTISYYSFADDLAMLLRRLFSYILWVHEGFGILRRAVCLRVNFDKSVFVLLHKCWSDVCFRRRVSAVAPLGPDALSHGIRNISAA